MKDIGQIGKYGGVVINFNRCLKKGVKFFEKYLCGGGESEHNKNKSSKLCA